MLAVKVKTRLDNQDIFLLYLKLFKSLQSMAYTFTKIHIKPIITLMTTGVLQTDSSSEEDSSEEEGDSELEHEWGELDADAGSTEESTKR